MTIKASSSSNNNNETEQKESTSMMTTEDTTETDDLLLETKLHPEVLQILDAQEEGEEEEEEATIDTGGSGCDPLVVDGPHDAGDPPEEPEDPKSIVVIRDNEKLDLKATLDNDQDPKKKKDEAESSLLNEICDQMEQNDDINSSIPAPSLSWQTAGYTGSRPGAYSIQVLSSRGGVSSSSPPVLPENSQEAASAAENPTTLTNSSTTIAQETQQQDLEAVAVDAEDVEQQVRDQIYREAVQADHVTAVMNGRSSKKNRLLMLVAALVVATGLAVGLAVGLSSPSSSASSNSEDESSPPFVEDDENNEDVGAATEDSGSSLLDLPTLHRVRKRGHLNCGVVGTSLGFSSPETSENGTAIGPLKGFNIDYCKAIALAVFQNASKYETKILYSKERFIALQNHSVDVLSQATTHTMGRDVFEPSSEGGFSFSVPFMYSGLAFGGVPEFVECADQLETIQGLCRQLRICVGLGTTHERILDELLTATYIVKTNSPAEHIEYLNNGTCNVLARDSVQLPAERQRQAGYVGPYQLGKRIFSREPLVLTTRSDDAQWTDLVNAIVNLFYTAEADGLSQEQAKERWTRLAPTFPVPGTPTNDYTWDLEALMMLLVSEFGNYGDLYERNLESLVPRDGLNLVHTTPNSTGLLYHFPFGKVDAEGPGMGETLSDIMTRGSLRCGIIPRPGLAEWNPQNQTWQGLDIEFCKAVHAAIHIGDTTRVEYINLADPMSRYRALFNGTVDVIAGSRMSLQVDVEEPTTKAGFTFSTPYYFDSSKVGEAYAMLTRQDDPQWSDFVYWVIMATVFAEDQGMSIADGTAYEMTAVNLFGQSLKQMFLDALSAVGNYQEIYDRSGLGLRSGANRLNEDLRGPQQFPFPLI